MTALEPSLVFTVAIALLLPLAVAGFVALLVRRERRAERTGERLRAGQLFGLLAGTVSGRVAGRELQRAAKHSGPESFWDALEAIITTLRMRERLRLARSLAKSRHLARERRVLSSDEPASRRELAARRLGLLPGERSRRALRRALVRGPEPVRLAAARALARHRDLGTLRWLIAHPDSLASRPLSALAGLLRGFGPGARALMIAALEHGLADTRLECACMEALGLARCRSARGSITARLASRQLELRVTAARSLGRLGMGEAIPALTMALEDESWPVRAMAAQALGRLSASPAIDALVRCVTDRSWWVRHHAAYALAAIGGDGLVALGELAARAEDRYAREMAIEALEFGVGMRRE